MSYTFWCLTIHKMVDSKSFIYYYYYKFFFLFEESTLFIVCFVLRGCNNPRYRMKRRTNASNVNTTFHFNRCQKQESETYN